MSDAAHLTCHQASLRHAAARGERAALDGVSLTIAPGERVAVVGANGSGKSSLLRLLHGVATPTSGTVTRAANLSMAMVFQRPRMLRMPVQRQLALGLWLGGCAWHESKARAVRALVRVGLGGVAQQSARTLSAGQQQRVALAQCWARAPDVLFLDEPTASLDPHAKREVEALMAELAADGMTLVFASHNLGQVKRLATRVLYLERGRLLADLPVAEFFDRERLRAASPEAALFVKGESA